VAITMMLNTYLTIKNESTFALEKVTWNGVDFGSMAVNAAPVKKIVKADRAQITFSVPGKGLNAKINTFLEIRQGDNATYSISDTVFVTEINETIAGIFENASTLKLVEKADAPKTGSLNITDISYVSAKLNSSIEKSGNPQFTEKGFCYSKELGDVEFSNCVAVDGEFIKTIESLSDSTKYYVKTYISNGKHPKQYSEAVSFNTLSGIPSASVGNATNVSYNTATLNGSVLKSGTPSYTERGFCYGTNSKPEKGGANTVCEAVTGTTLNFLFAATGLADTTKYYVRAYIDNGKHTIQYSDTASFTTLSGLPNVALSGIANVTTSSALLKGSVLNTVNPDYTEKGFCYSNTNNLPVKGTSTATCEIVEGEQRNFELELTSLQIAKKYYARAYIENSYGTIYSDTVTFETNIFVDDRDNRKYKIKDIGGGIVWFMDDLAYNAKTQYTWTEAKEACPTGWRLPNNSDWENIAPTANRVVFPIEFAWWTATDSFVYYYMITAAHGSFLTSQPSSANHRVRCVKN